jgi:hypothetical protein
MNVRQDAIVAGLFSNANDSGLPLLLFDGSPDGRRWKFEVSATATVRDIRPAVLLA